MLFHVEFFAARREIFRVEIQQARGLGAIAAGFPERSFDDRFLAGVEFRRPPPKFRLLRGIGGGQGH